MLNRDVLITGGAGFIGSRLAARLLETGWRVTIADVLHPQVHSATGWPTDLPDDVVKLPIDVTSPSQWDAVLRVTRPDAIVHLAAETGTGQSLTLASRHGLVNVVGTTEMLDALVRAGHTPQQFVLASSRAVYGEGQWEASNGVSYYAAPRTTTQLEAGEWDPRPEDPALRAVRPLAHDASVVWPRPTNVYAATKLAQEHVLGAWTVAMGSRLSVLRLQNVYGPGQSLSNPYTGIMAFFGRKSLAKEQIDVYEGGDIVRDLVYIDDVVNALTLSVNRDGRESLTADIGSGRPVTLLEAARILAAETGAPAPATSANFRPGDVRAAFADIRRAHALIGYTPRTPPEQGLQQLVRWIAEQR